MMTNDEISYLILLATCFAMPLGLRIVCTRLCDGYRTPRDRDQIRGRVRGVIDHLNGMRTVTLDHLEAWNPRREILSDALTDLRLHAKTADEIATIEVFSYAVGSLHVLYGGTIADHHHYAVRSLTAIRIVLGLLPIHPSLDIEVTLAIVRDPADVLTKLDPRVAVLRDRAHELGEPRILAEALRTFEAAMAIYAASPAPVLDSLGDPTAKHPLTDSVWLSMASTKESPKDG